jgi:hypothetical protein
MVRQITKIPIANLVQSALVLEEKFRTIWFNKELLFFQPLVQYIVTEISTLWQHWKKVREALYHMCFLCGAGLLLFLVIFLPIQKIAVINSLFRDKMLILYFSIMQR